jgi:hypothetical protein
MTPQHMRSTIRQILADWNNPDVRAAAVAALWAHQLGLSAGNLWEPALVRNMLAEWRRLGADEQAWAFIEATYRIRLGLAHNKHEQE